MLIRIVHMYFRAEGVDNFIRLFEENVKAIQNSPGCQHLELLNDLEDEMHYTTISHWDDDESLEEYRRSALFRTVWASVKPLFSAPSRAYSMKKFLVPDSI